MPARAYTQTSTLAKSSCTLLRHNTSWKCCTVAAHYARLLSWKVDRLLRFGPQPGAASRGFAFDVKVDVFKHGRCVCVGQSSSLFPFDAKAVILKQ